MKWTTRILVTAAIAATIATQGPSPIGVGAAVSAANVAPVPEVAVTVIAAPDGADAGFQMEWDGSVLREHGEEWCATARCVNDTLAKIGEEYTYSVQWVRV